MDAFIPWHFGYMAHIGVDQGTVLVHYLEMAAANGTALDSAQFSGMMGSKIEGKRHSLRGSPAIMKKSKRAEHHVPKN